MWFTSVHGELVTPADMSTGFTPYEIREIVFEISETRVIHFEYSRYRGNTWSLDTNHTSLPDEVAYPVLVNVTSLWTFSAFSRSSCNTFTFSLIIPIASSPTAKRMGN